MKIAIGADHAGFEAKQLLRAHLEKNGHQVTDLGTSSPEPCDYPEPSYRVGKAVADGKAERGVLVCGSGVGMSIVANKVPGVRAAFVLDDYLAEMSRRHNDANVICLAARINAQEALERFTDKFLATEFEGGRHAKRVAKIAMVEKGQAPG
jgi:ribose 5-phosphate isomerase B